MDVERAREVIAASPPRRLRLSELLEELGACDDDPPLGTRPSHVSLGELVDKAAEAGFGFLVGVLVLLAIPFVGFSTPFGIAIALLGLQMMVGRPRPWLPWRARRRELTMHMIDRIATLLARRTRWIVKATSRRWEVLIQARVVGLGIFVLAVGLALPLPIPGSNWVFLLPLFVYAIGILERDGAWILAGHILAVVDVVLLVVFWQVVSSVLAGVWQWLT